ncbi:hypothetical protein [Actinomadura rubrisoli]|uniref:Uncharacterized protein n=1 Tax=Actinomadura rubrisoli TaxID=2530368 RepID=A0A4R5CGD1_9ACTN|nr:hypothetical protein [Actinomadura rubrisoli]TDD96312.1 hypothetical protein E1298_03310 [Actinomadura rubrisoli]
MLMVSGCAATGRRATAAPSSPSASALKRVEQALIMPRATGKPDPVRYGVASGPFEKIIKELIAGPREPDACVWGQTSSGQLEGVTTGPVRSAAALGIWTDSARSVMVSESIVALPDTTASKLIAKPITTQCRDHHFRSNGEAMRMFVESDNVRRRGGRIERLTTYILSTPTGAQRHQYAIIRVNGHVVFLALSPARKPPAPGSYTTITQEAGTQAVTVLGRL